MKKNNFLNFLIFAVVILISPSCSDKICSAYQLKNIELRCIFPSTYAGRICPIPKLPYCSGTGENWVQFLKFNAASGQQPYGWNPKKYLLWVEFTGCEDYAFHPNFQKLIKAGIADYSVGAGNVKGFNTYFLALNVSQIECHPIIEIPVEFTDELPNIITVRFLEPCSVNCEHQLGDPSTIFCQGLKDRVRFSSTQTVNFAAQSSGTAVDFPMLKDKNHCNVYCKY